MAKMISRLFLVTALLSAVSFSVSTFAQEVAEEELQSASTFAGAYLAGAAAMQNFDFAAAAFYYDEALTYDPQNTDLQRELLVAYLNNGQFEQSLPLAQQLMDVQSVERISRLVLGVDAIRNRRFNDAQTLLILTQQNDIERLLTGIIRAWASFGSGNIDLALEKIDDLSGPAWFDLFKSYHGALVADAAGRSDEARRRYEDAVNDATGGSASPLTYLRLVETYAGFLLQNGEIDAANEIIARGIAIAPNNPVLLSLSKGLSTNTEVLRIKDSASGTAEILLNIGSAINREGAETFATIYLELASVARANEAQTLFELGTIADRLKLTEKAINLYKQIPENSSLFRTAALQQGLALSLLDRNEEAIETLQELVRQNPDDYSGYIALGGVLATERRYEEAIILYTQALEELDATEPNFWPIHYRLGIAFERTKQWPKAEERFKYALTLSPDQADILNYLGYSWVDMNINLDEGMAMIEKAVQLRPRDGYILDSLGWAQYRLGQFESAIESLERATDLRPRDPTINDHLGDAYWRIGRKLEAAFQWSQVLEMEDNDDINMDNVREKLKLANSGQAPSIAKSSVDTLMHNKQASDLDNKADDG